MMVMVAFSLRGYWRTLSERTAWTPAITMATLTTIAMTGRRMKRSVNFMGRSLVRRLRRQLDLRRQLVLHHDAHAVLELERAAGHHRLAGIEARVDHHDVAAAL